MFGSVTMYTHSEFECQVFIAAENARRDGYTHTYLAILDVIRILRHGPNGEHEHLELQAVFLKH